MNPFQPCVDLPAGLPAGLGCAGVLPHVECGVGWVLTCDVPMQDTSLPRSRLLTGGRVLAHFWMFRATRNCKTESTMFPRPFSVLRRFALACVWPLSRHVCASAPGLMCDTCDPLPCILPHKDQSSYRASRHLVAHRSTVIIHSGSLAPSFAL